MGPGESRQSSGGNALNRLAVVTDSTCDLDREEAKKNGISILPLYVTHRESVYRDTIDITSSEFYPLLKDRDELPKTSQPSPEDFARVYREILNSANEIISIHISGGLSSTVEAARRAAESVGPGRIHVVDSKFLTFAMSFQALEAVSLAIKGIPTHQILSLLTELREKTEMLFTLDTMEYLHRGGRIGKVKSLMGTILGIKPVVRVEDGVYIPHGKARSLGQALVSMVEFLGRKFGRQKVIAAVGHGQGAEYAAKLTDMVKKTLNLAGEPYRFEVGPVIGVHTGPGTIGLAVRPAKYC